MNIFQKGNIFFVSIFIFSYSGITPCLCNCQFFNKENSIRLLKKSLPRPTKVGLISIAHTWKQRQLDCTGNSSSGLSLSLSFSSHAPPPVYTPQSYTIRGNF
jgi:hypothetical protein